MWALLVQGDGRLAGAPPVDAEEQEQPHHVDEVPVPGGGLDLRGNDAGDGPAVFVILGLGAIVMMLVFWVEFRFEPPWWVHVVIWAPLTVGLAVWLLRLLKALLIAQQYTHRSTALDG